MPNTSLNMLVILVSNIIVDCTVNVSILFPSGLILSDGYYNVFDLTIDQACIYV